MRTPNNKVIILFLGIGSISLLLIFWAIHNKSSFEKPQESQLNIPATRHLILDSEKIVVPEIKATQSISKLPPDLNPLIIPKPSSLSLEKIIFINGKAGFRIKMDLDFPFSSVLNLYHKQLYEHNSWQRLTDVYSPDTEKLGLIEIENFNYQVQIVLQKQDEDNSKVIINAIQK